jgi:hypothetical protein
MKEITVYDFVKNLFVNRNAFKDVTDKQKSSFFFLTNRILSIEFPEKANCFNHIDTNPIAAINAWENFIRMKNFRSVPGWIYTKFASTHKKITSKAFEFDKEILKFFMQKYQMNDTDFNECVKYAEDALIEELKFLKKNREFYGI